MPWEIGLNSARSELVCVAVGILKREDKILIAKRPSDKPYSGYWEFPGGKIENDESAGEALARELKEELGVVVINAKPWFSYTHSYPDKSVLLEIWLVTKFMGEPHGKENQELHWATYPELLALRLLEGNKTIIERIKTLYE